MEDKQIGNALDRASQTTYLSEIDKIETSEQPPEIKVELLDILVKDYFRKRYHIKRNAEYEEMIEFFMQKNKPNVAGFCHEMILAMYSGDMIGTNNISVLLEDAKSMIEKEEGIDKNIGVKINNMITPFLSKLNILSKKKKMPMKNDDTVGKQTKKIIDQYLERDDSVIEEAKKNSVLDETQLDQSLMYELNPALVPQVEEAEESDEVKAIRNIDDLERIKKKIKQRKVLVKRDR